jgi:hypothetical protein
MILERIEKNELIDAIYESSNITASTYNKNLKLLNITFSNGSNYTYQDVSETDYVRFETAESQGKVLNSNIKKYSFLKHDNVDVENKLKRIKEVKEIELKYLKIGIIDTMKDIIDFHDNSGELANPHMTKLDNMIKTYYKTI